MNNYILYFVDTETTGLDPINNDVIELSLYRLQDDIQKTWKLKPTNLETIDDGALRVNKHKREDITWKTKFGMENYQEANKVIIEIENFVLEDGTSAEKRCLVAQNTAFDMSMMKGLWNKCGSADSFPFGRRYLDTMIVAMFNDYVCGTPSEGYSLANLTKRYGIKNTRAHTAEADTVAVKEVFLAQVKEMREKLKFNATT